MIYLLLFIIYISIRRFQNSPVYIDENYMLVDLIIAGVLIVIYIYINKGKFKNILLSHSSIFFLSYLIIYYQYDIDFLLGNTQATNSLAWQFDSGVCKSLCISNAALASFTLALKNTKKSFSSKFNIQFINTKAITLISVVALVSFIITVDKGFILGGYSIVPMGAIASQFEEMLQMSLIALFVIISYNIRKMNLCRHSVFLFFQYFKIPLIITFIYILLLSLAGARYAVLRMILVAAISYLYSLRPKIPLSYILIVVLALATLFTLQGLSRNGKNDLSESVEVLNEGASISPITSELAFSVTASHIALAEVPDSYEFNKGITFLPYFLLLIPGMRGLFYTLFNVSPEMLSSSHFITYIGLGTLDNFGVGSSSIADIYISYGLVGVLIIIYLFGIIVRKLEYSTFSANITSPYLIAFSYCVYSQMLYSNRESILTIFTGIPYVLIFVFIAIKLSKPSYRKSKFI